MKNCVIVEDEQTALEVAKHLAVKYGALNILATFDKAEEALVYVNKNGKVDIVFLDIHLPDMSGFSFLENLTSTPKVVLVTADKNLALTAYNFDLVVDYLVKPLQKDRFMEAINQC
ncbi:response regulator [Flavobacteriaceae bacterium]|nr:response regulator [Flavobacteriaceae bacterium]